MKDTSREPSQYVQLLELRKMCLQEGREGQAAALFDSARGLVEAGLVSANELEAGAYI